MGKHLGVAYNLRLSQELKDKISESAKELNRSMNADIVARLEQSFYDRKNLEELDRKEILGEIINIQNLLNEQRNISDKQYDGILNKLNTLNKKEDI